MASADRPLRIALLAYRGKPHCGGQGIYVRHLSKALVDLGHEVTVFGGPAPPGNVNPVYEYLHEGLAPDPNFQGNSVTGGYVYRGPIEELQGRYVFGDAVSGHVWSSTVPAASAAA